MVMNLNGFDGKWAPTPHLKLRVCDLCDKEFSTTSINTHIPRCYAKKLAQWESANPRTRGSKPKLPDTINFREGSSRKSQVSISLKESATEQANTGGGSSLMQSSAPHRLKSTRTTSARPVGMRPMLPSCYLCGQQFGTTSIGIHVPQCYAKKLAQWQVGDPATRGSKPKHPDTVNWRGGPGISTEEQSDMQFKEFLNNLEPCPNCGRKFLSDRLVVHLRSCRPGNTAKPPTHLRKNTYSNATGKASSARSISTGLSTLPSTVYPRDCEKVVTNVENMKNEKLTANETRCRPGTQSRSTASKSRLPDLHPRSQQTNGIRTCHHCMATECDSNAKFCSECGCNLSTENMPDPCKRCGEMIPNKSRYCGTCGEPVVNVIVAEREAGSANENAPTVRMSTCPACKALCCDDANFCDNCGAVLEGQAVLLTKETCFTLPPGPTKPCSMYCTRCAQFIREVNAVYCEDCGGKLEKRMALGVARDPDKLPSRPISAETLVRQEGKKNLLPLMTTSLTRKASPPATLIADTATSALGGFTSTTQEELLEDSSDGIREPCRICGRKFAPEVLQKHLHSCTLRPKKRPVFNIKKKWLEGLEPAPHKNRTATESGRSQSASKPVVKKWKAQSEDFRNALRAAKEVDRYLKSGGDPRLLPPPKPTVNSDYVECRYCKRKFNEEVAKRHIPHCANTINRPKPPPKQRGI